MRVRGYAAPFGRPIIIDGVREVILPSAFDEMLRVKKQVALQFATHDAAPALARTGNGTLVLAVDGFGLRFEADLDDKNLGVQFASYEIARDRQRCSVNFSDWNVRVSMGANDIPTRYIVRAQINHIAIVAEEEAAYRDTGVWRAGNLGRHVPDRIKALANRFEWLECKSL